MAGDTCPVTRVTASEIRGMTAMTGLEHVAALP